MKFLKAAKIWYIAISAIFCIIGLMLIIHPGFSIGFIGTLCGIALIVFGVVKLAGYFSGDAYRAIFKLDMAAGILSVILGIVIVINPQGLLNLICIVLGVAVLLDGIFKIQTAIESKRMGVGRWQLIMIPAVITGIAGLILLLRPAESGELLTIILGVSVFCGGVMNLITALTAVKIDKNKKPDVIEIEAEVEDK